MLRKLEWYARQLLPLTYVSKYGQDNKTMLCIWRMWFGRCFNVRYYELAGG
jgi:hypothetical protein